MTQPRSELVCTADTPYYHVISRCVRRAFLCGVDTYSGCSFEHRRAWIQDRIYDLTSVFTLDLCAYAIMSNHYHLVVRLRPEDLDRLTDHDVVQRWGKVFSLPMLVQRWLTHGPLSAAETAVVDSLIRIWRARLGDLSWFMRCLNEDVARRANREDGCTGRFWEGRFKSQALLDEKALLACMSYVDLNPVRAGIAETPERADYTAVQQRIRGNDPRGLAPFQSQESTHEASIPFAFPDYLELLNWHSLALTKQDAVVAAPPRILARLAIPENAWRQALNGYRDHFGPAIGPVGKLRLRCRRLHRKWLCGLRGINLLYLNPQPS